LLKQFAETASAEKRQLKKLQLKNFNWNISAGKIQLSKLASHQGIALAIP